MVANHYDFPPKKIILPHLAGDFFCRFNVQSLYFFQNTPYTNPISKLYNLGDHMTSLLTSIDEREAARYLGCQENPLPSDIQKRIQKASQKVMELAAPRIIEREFHFYNATFQLENTCFQIEGHSAHDYLKNCDSCILMAATLGSAIDELIRRTQITDMAEAVVIDSCASCAIENVCNNWQKQTEERLKESHRYATDRFSPGYGDLPLTMQREFCQLLDTSRKIGLSVSDGGLLTPIKSVTAILGIAKEPQPKKITGCQNCLLKGNCQFRKGGTTCGQHNPD